jgi:SAM-dependent methyltransferase
MLRLIYDALPPRVRAFAKQVLRASGHQASFLDALRGKYHAKFAKRFDVVADYLSKQLAAASINSLAGKRCMEFGCGYLPVELVYYWTIGASKLIAVDYNRVAQFQYIPLALRGTPHAGRFKIETIDYLAPFDARREPLPVADLIHSESVLEHIPVQDVVPILENLSRSLAPGGTMIHAIDLKDHLDPRKDPIEFLRPESRYDPLTDFDPRGNRLRKSDWVRAFAGLRDVETTCLPRTSNPPYTVPGYSLDDLSTVSVLMICKKRG